MSTIDVFACTWITTIYYVDSRRVFGSTTRVTRVSSDNVNIAAEHQEPAEVLFQLGNTFGLQGRVVDVAHVGQAHPCYTSRIAE